jgi:mannose-6-phosphate isomerase-like protein (cupin superfamily)
MNFRELLNTETEGWFSQPIGSVEGCTVTARVMQNVQADFHVHKHSDEMFIVLKGRLVLEFEAESIVLLTGQTHTVRKGVLHRAKADARVEMLTVMKRNS